MHVCASCSISVKLTAVAGGTGGQVIAGLTSPVLWFTEIVLPFPRLSFVDNHHFLINVPIDFWLLPDLTGCCSMVEFKTIVITPAITLFIARVRLAVAVTWLLRALGDRLVGHCKREAC